MATNNAANNKTAASGTVLQGQGVGTASDFSTATYPATTTINQVLYSSSANAVSGLATANSAVLATNGSGVPSITATPTVTSITFGAGSALSSYITTTSYTPVLSFGGGTTGITYSQQSGNYVRIGQLVFVSINITLTNKGSSTGNASITLPVAQAQTDYLLTSAQNITYTGNIIFTTAAGGLVQSYVTATSGANLTNTAFANNSIITITGCYLV